MPDNADHYFSSDPRAAHDVREIREEIRGLSLRFLTDSGVFSKARVDRGTCILLEALPLAELTRGEGALLDLGCGYGPIGIVLAKLLPDRTVYMTDPNQRAVDLARRNAEINGVANVHILVGEGYDPLPPGLKLAAIVTNPPIRAGKGVVYGLVDQAPARLRPGGSFTCVAQTKQGAKSLKARIESVFGNVRELEREGGFRVLHATAANTAP